MADYAELIDDEIWALIAKTNASYPPDAVDLSVQEQRAVYDQMCAEFRVEYPHGVLAEDRAINEKGEREIPIRSYATCHNHSPKAQILY